MFVDVYAATPIEVVPITAADYAVAVGVGILVALLAAGFGMWVFWPEKPQPTPPPAEVDPPEAAKTVELPPRRPGLRAAPTIHAPQYRRPTTDDETVFIEQPGARY